MLQNPDYNESTLNIVVKSSSTDTFIQTVRREHHILDLKLTPRKWRLNSFLNGHRYLDVNQRKPLTPMQISRPNSAKTPPTSKPSFSVTRMSPKENGPTPKRISKFDTTPAAKKMQKAGISRRSLRQNIVSWKPITSKSRGRSFSTVLLEVKKASCAQTMAQTSPTLVSNDTIVVFPEQLETTPSLSGEVGSPPSSPLGKFKDENKRVGERSVLGLSRRVASPRKDEGFRFYSAIQEKPELELESSTPEVPSHTTPVYSSPLWSFACLNPYSKTFRPISPQERSSPVEKMEHASSRPTSSMSDKQKIDETTQSEKQWSLLEIITPLFGRLSSSATKHLPRSESTPSEEYAPQFEQLPGAIDTNEEATLSGKLSRSDCSSPSKKRLSPAGLFLSCSERSLPVSTSSIRKRLTDGKRSLSDENEQRLSTGEKRSSVDETKVKNRQLSPVDDRKNSSVCSSLFGRYLLGKRDLDSERSLSLDENCLPAVPGKCSPFGGYSLLDSETGKAPSQVENQSSFSTLNVDGFEDVSLRSVSLEHVSEALALAAANYQHCDKSTGSKRKAPFIFRRFVGGMTRLRTMVSRAFSFIFRHSSRRN